MINVKNLVLGIGIVIVFALVLWQGIEAFYPSPQYDDFCGSINAPQPLLDKDQTMNQTFCEENDGIWTNGYCDYYSKCQKEYDAAQKAHAKPVFIISIIVAIIVIILGYFILSVEPVGSALIGSGIWALFYGSVVNWRNFTTVWRFLLLLVVLILLIWITVRFNRKRSSKK